MPAYANEPAWFIGRIDGDLYPQPAGSATLTEHAEIQKAALLHSLSSGDHITDRGFELTVDGGATVSSLDDQVAEAHTGAMSLGRNLENQDVHELTAKVAAGDGEHLEPLSVMAYNIFTGDEQRVIDNMDNWADFVHRSAAQIPIGPTPPDQGPGHGRPKDDAIPPGSTGAAVVTALSIKGQGPTPDIVRLPDAKFRPVDGRDDVVTY